MKNFKFFTALNQKDCGEVPIETAIENLTERKAILEADNLENTKVRNPIYEFCSDEDTTRKYYFDIDAPFEKLQGDGTIDALEGNLETYVSDCFKIPTDDVLSICKTPSTVKLSFHITLNYKGHYTNIKTAAILLGEYIHSKHPKFSPKFVDPMVYGKTQKWRCIYASKEGENRFKLPLKGSIEDSFITCLPSRTLPTLQTLPAQTNLSPKLKWFGAVLAEPLLASLWAQKTDYESWVVVGGSLYVESHKTPGTIEAAEELYQKFSGDNREEVHKKFTTAFATKSKDQFNLIRKWVKDFNKTVDKTYEPLFSGQTGRIVRSTNMDADDVAENDDIELPNLGFECVTYRQFMLYRHITHSSKLYQYWGNKLQSGDAASLIAILEGDEMRNVYGRVENVCRENLGSIAIDNYSPYGHINLKHRSFLDWIKTVYSILELDEDVTILCNAITQTYADYKEACKSLDEDIFNETEKLGFQLPRLGSREQTSPSERIRSIITEERYYQMQYPYQYFLRGLFRECNEDWNKFWLCLPHFSNPHLICESCFHFICRAYDDVVAARIVFDLYPFWRLSPSGQVYVYDDSLGIWSTDENVKSGIVTRFERFLENQTEKTVVNYGLGANKATKVQKIINTCDAVRLLGCRAFNENKESGFYKLPFRNGYYDGISDSFFGSDKVRYKDKAYIFYNYPHIMFFGRIDNDYVPFEQCDPAIFETMKTKIFIDMHGEEVGNQFMQALGSIVMGHSFKGFLEIIGDTHSGKSTLTEFNRNSLNSLVGEGSAEYFITNPNDHRPIDRRNGFVVDTWCCRILECSEKPPKGSKIDTERMKTFSSGRKDPVPASKLYHNKDSYDVHFSVIFYANSKLEFTDETEEALIGRRYTYVCRGQYVDEITDPTCQLLIDPAVEQWKSSKQHQLIYVQILIQAFLAAKSRGYRVERPVSMQIVSATRTTTSDKLDQLLQWVIVTGNETDRITSKDLETIVTEKMSAGNYNTVIIQLKALLATKGVVITSIQTRLPGEKTKKQVWTGIRERASKADDYSMLNDAPGWMAAIEKCNGLINSNALKHYKTVEALVCSTAPLTDQNIELITSDATQTQREYYYRNNQYAANKVARVEPSSLYTFN